MSRPATADLRYWAASGIAAGLVWLAATPLLGAPLAVVPAIAVSFAAGMVRRGDNPGEDQDD